MSLPRLNRRLTVEKPVRVPDDAGGYVETWTPVGVVWAEVRARTGREVAASGTVVSRVPYAIVVRGAPVGHPGRLAPEHRFRDGQRLFHIRSVAEHDANGRYLICISEEEVVT
jgi:SPP1 family predicted phage head-tail adaptor